MVLQSYGLSISSDDECIESRLANDNDGIISDRKSVNYSDNMLAMSPFAGDYPPTSNYINYTDLDASYATQGKDPSGVLSSRDFRSELKGADDAEQCSKVQRSLFHCSLQWCTLASTHLE